jgi:hypothetical protein
MAQDLEGDRVKAPLGPFVHGAHAASPSLVISTFS